MVAGEKIKNKYRLRNPLADFEEKKYEGEQQAKYLFSNNNTKTCSLRKSHLHNLNT